MTETSLKDWCSRGAFWDGLIEKNGKTRAENIEARNPNKTSSGTQARETTGDKEAKEEENGDNRRLLE